MSELLFDTSGLVLVHFFQLMLAPVGWGGHNFFAKRRSGWACIGNPKLEQETIEGTHARETPAHQRRPTDILCVLQDRLLLSDVSVIHCRVDTYVETAAATAGSTAEVHAAKKVAKYALREPGGYDFTTLVVESYGCQYSATHTLLNLLGRLAADSGRVTKGAWVEGALRLSLIHI